MMIAFAVLLLVFVHRVMSLAATSDTQLFSLYIVGVEISVTFSGLSFVYVYISMTGLFC